MTRPLTAAGAAVLLAVTVLVGCGGDDDGSEQFCDAVTDVQQRGADITALDLPNLPDERLEEAKAAVLGLAEAIRTAIEEAPDEVAEVLEDGLPLIDDAIAGIEDATSVDDLITEGEELIAVLQTTPSPQDGTRQEFSQAIADECAEE